MDGNYVLSIGSYTKNRVKIYLSDCTKVIYFMKMQIFSNTVDEVQKEMNYFCKDNPVLLFYLYLFSTYKPAKERGWQDFTILTVVLVYKQ